MFVGRETEIKYLEHFYRSEDSNILVVYGAKGVGKTSLLRHFSTKYDFGYYLARNVSAKEQMNLWQEELGLNLDNPDYSKLLQAMVRPFSDNKQIIILDEFQYIVKSNDSFMDALIQFIKASSKNMNLLILLCSSSVSWVEGDMIKDLGQHVTKIQGLLKVKELPLRDIKRIYPSLNFRELIQYFSMLGGNISLWDSMDFSLSVKENIIRNILPIPSRLHDKMRMILLEDLRETAVYNTILLSLANGKNKLNDIYLHTGFSRAKISVYLKNLMLLGYVEKIFSFDFGNTREMQKGSYRICNRFLLFYYRFIFPHLSYLYEYDQEDFYEQFVQAYMDDFYQNGYAFACKEYLSSKMAAIGEWYGKSGNIQIVCKDTKNQYYAGNCYWNQSVSETELKELYDMVNKAKIPARQYFVFSEEGKTDDVELSENTIIISLSKDV